VIFRVCRRCRRRPQVAAHWFAAPTAPSHLSVWTLPFSLQALLRESKDSRGRSPHDLLFSLRVWRSAQPLLLAPFEGGVCSHGSSLEVCCPFSVHGPRQPLIRSLASAAMVRPRRFSRPRRFAPPASLPRFPRVTLMGFSVLQGNSRPALSTMFPSLPSLLVLPSQRRLLPASACTVHRAPKSVSAPLRW
jgi:hypothetical protein